MTTLFSVRSQKSSMVEPIGVNLEALSNKLPTARRMSLGSTRRCPMSSATVVTSVWSDDSRVGRSA